MGKETRLLKDFNESDLNRIRNLIKKDYNGGTKTQVGYQKEIVDHNEGDVWEENGKTWTIKNGIKQSVSKLDQFKKQYFIPLACPECNNPLKSQLDTKMYRVHTKCMNCVSIMETKLKLEGKYEEYKNTILKNNVIGGIDMYKEWLIEEVENTGNESFISEDGVKEDWSKKKDIREKVYNELIPELDKIKEEWKDHEETKAE